MQTFSRFVITLFACTGLTLVATAGPEPIARSYKESKEVVPPAPPACDWSGIYIGLHVGGQFGHSENVDHDYNVGGFPVATAARTETPTGPPMTSPDRPWGYSESGFVGGGQVGYNFQFGHIVFGPEFDIGYMNLDGRGTEPGSPGEDTRGESDSDLYVTFKGRIGFALDCWLFYATAGGIGVNYDTRVVDDCDTGNCGENRIDAHKQEFSWGPTVGGGVERKIGRHWSIKIEYLFFDLDEQSFTGTAQEGPPPCTNSPNGRLAMRFPFQGETEGHMVRGGLNFRF